MRLTKPQRAALKEKFDGKCAYCGTVLGDKWHADHIEPIHRIDWTRRFGGPGGEALSKHKDTLENLNPACPPCNIDKHSMSLEAWRGVISRSNDVLFRDVSTFRRAVRYGLVIQNASPVVFHFEKVAQEQEKGHE